MRGYENLNTDYSKIKVIDSEGNCETVNECKHTFTRWDGVIPCTGREICNDCGKQLN